MDKPFHREKPQGEPQEQLNKEASAEGLREINLPPPDAQAQKLEDLGDIPAAPRKRFSRVEEHEAQGPLRPPKTVAELVKIIGKLGENPDLDAKTAKMVQDAMREAQENQN